MQNLLELKQNQNHKKFMKDFWMKLSSPDKTLVFSRKFEKYLDEIESITNVKITQKQKDFLKKEIESCEYKRLSTEESKAWRKEFSKVKNELISEWEQNTGMKWKTYDQDVYNERGQIIRRAGGKWDAHEIILNSWGSPHVWENITPAPHPEHQRDIHGKNSVCAQIFGR
jgi:hypothetical protein